MMKPCRVHRSGQSLVEFAVVALVLYMLLAAILTFGHMLYVAQGLQSAADLAAREISRTPFGAIHQETMQPLTFDDLTTLKVGTSEETPNDRFRKIFDEAWLVIDLNRFYADHPGGSVFEILVPQMPPVNQQLAMLMIVDRPTIDSDPVIIGPNDNASDPPPSPWFLRYPGALLKRSTNIQPPFGATDYPPCVATGYTVGIPLVSSRASDGVETIRWIPIVEEIEPSDVNDPRYNPFSIVNTVSRGIVALRINCPVQSAAMSSFRHDRTALDFPFEPTVGSPNAADDDGVVEINPSDRPGDTVNSPLLNGNLYAGTYGGQYGLGAQGALGSEELTGGRPIRPYRRVISAQAIYRREIFSD